jgi:hypothetical protein
MSFPSTWTCMYVCMYVCVRGGPNQPLHRDPQWSMSTWTGATYAAHLVFPYLIILIFCMRATCPVILIHLHHCNNMSVCVCVWLRHMCATCSAHLILLDLVILMTMRATCPAHPVLLDLIILMIFGEDALSHVELILSRIGVVVTNNNVFWIWWLGLWHFFTITVNYNSSHIGVPS